MIPFYSPFYKYQYFNRYNYSNFKKNSNNSFSIKSNNTNQKNHTTTNNDTISNIFSFLPTSIGPLNFHPEALSNIEKPIFEMFGINIYIDDIIIISILIFLYQENIQDELLYISLLLILLP